MTNYNIQISHLSFSIYLIKIPCDCVIVDIVDCLYARALIDNKNLIPYFFLPGLYIKITSVFVNEIWILIFEQRSNVRGFTREDFTLFDSLTNPFIHTIIYNLFYPFQPGLPLIVAFMKSATKFVVIIKLSK